MTQENPESEVAGDYPRCPSSYDIHCSHWYDDGTCCRCGLRPENTAAQLDKAVDYVLAHEHETRHLPPPRPTMKWTEGAQRWVDPEVES